MHKERGSWWTFTRSDVGGIVVLVFILIGLYCFKVWFVPFYDTVGIPSEEEVKDALIAFEPAEIETMAASNPSPELFEFDPNVISKDSLVLLGMTEQLATRFINYRTAIGSFREAEKVSRVYGLDSLLFKRIEPYMVFAAKEQTMEPKHIESEERQEVQKVSSPVPSEVLISKRTIDLNRATSEEFQKIYGIGPVLADRVIKYRSLLGGFLSDKQLFEVYGVDSNQVSLNKWDVVVDSQLVSSLALNTLNEKDLAAHPYVSWKQAKVIVNFRNQHGRYRSLEDFSQLKVFSNSEITQLTGYLEFD